MQPCEGPTAARPGNASLVAGSSRGAGWQWSTGGPKGQRLVCRGDIDR